MSFDTPAGTRGGRQPGSGGAVGRWMQKRVMNRTTIGRKSGAERQTPVGWFPGQDGSWLIVASAAGGPRNPAWYYNLAAHPDNVQIELPDRKLAVTAEQLHGAEREEAWRQITAAAPRFATYQQKTDRLLPVIRLVPRSG
jgi:deazaflavin-dependent oxidoreductase (nitroreductase family)